MYFKQRSRLAQVALFVFFSLFGPNLLLQADVGQVPPFFYDNEQPLRFVTLREGTVITLRLKDRLDTKTSIIGQNIRFEVEMDVLVNGQKVVAAGTQAFGKVANLHKPGLLGQPALMDVSLSHVLAVDGQSVPVKSVLLTRTGKNKRWLAALCFLAPIAVAIAAPAIWPIGFVAIGAFFVKGEHLSYKGNEDVGLDVRVSRDVVIKA